MTGYDISDLSVFLIIFVAIIAIALAVRRIVIQNALRDIEDEEKN